MGGREAVNYHTFVILVSLAVCKCLLVCVDVCVTARTVCHMRHSPKCMLLDWLGTVFLSASPSPYIPLLCTALAWGVRGRRQLCF